MYGELIRRGYQPVYTPVIGNVHLYETSGHYPYYKDSQFPPIEMPDGEQLPAQADELSAPCDRLQIEAPQLPRAAAAAGGVRHGTPLRAVGRVKRNDRVRGFTQDDAHIFCTEEQVADEFRACIEMTRFVLGKLGLDDYHVRLGFRDPKSDKYVGMPRRGSRPRTQ